jgi:hypothetical protein
MPESDQCPNPNCDRQIPRDAGRIHRSASGIGPGVLNESVVGLHECECGYKLIRAAEHPDSPWQIDRGRQTPDED